ncbi:response regulator transcription factor [Virgibacillus litoralis]|uniref:response regulator transcription factor n=1 Tax=Virgibacillus litoralis TaxID=578221 RepID=UPI001AEAA504
MTNRESQILDLLKVGSSSKQISKEINISINTVKAHMKQIYSKLEVKNKVDLILKCK